ncbi:hypothetical protein EXIGLDRAFT_204503 [Exidia glandulosa HHB12029]|uniref:Uncharacterized protein n=1 Tax=Exidia glandulosa HHB12029 TaxID=1314781 RepID=A0A165EMY8_EXIGL|nr:hypothetical protein EXIGLDRAFT_204503 [Exidia glandulosa HHB12029]
MYFVECWLNFLSAPWCASRVGGGRVGDERWLISCPALAEIAFATSVGSLSCLHRGVHRRSRCDERWLMFPRWRRLRCEEHWLSSRLCSGCGATSNGALFPALAEVAVQRAFTLPFPHWCDRCRSFNPLPPPSSIVFLSFYSFLTSIQPRNPVSSPSSFRLLHVHAAALLLGCRFGIRHGPGFGVSGSRSAARSKAHRRPACSSGTVSDGRSLPSPPAQLPSGQAAVWQRRWSLPPTLAHSSLRLLGFVNA